SRPIRPPDAMSFGLIRLLPTALFTPATTKKSFVPRWRRRLATERDGSGPASAVNYGLRRQSVAATALWLGSGESTGPRGLFPAGSQSDKSQRDFASKPRVGAKRLPWVPYVAGTTPTGLRHVGYARGQPVQPTALRPAEMPTCQYGGSA